MAACERWYFTKEQLANTPSRKCGTDADKELSYRQQSANFIQDMGQRLQVTQLCINTAIVYMHRFYMFHPFTKFHRNAISTCALFLAAKVEEQPRKLEHVIKVAHLCLHRDGPTLDTKTEAYLEQAHELVINENIMLQTLGFDIGIDHPHTYVVKCCQLVLASKDLAQTSYFMATNSLHLTTMCLQYKPTAVACLCIHLACKWSNWKIPQSSEGKEWFWYVDKQVTHQVLEELTSEFLAILDKCPSRLKRKIMSGKESQPIEKKPKTDMASSTLNLNSSGMDNDTDLETYLNSKDFLDKQDDLMEAMVGSSSSQPSSSHANSNNYSSSSSRKPSPTVASQLSSLKSESDTLALSSPQVLLSSPSKKRAETLSLAAYREKKEKRRSEQPVPAAPPPAAAPPSGSSKEHHSHNSHWKAESDSVKASGMHQQHHSSHSTQEGSGERHKGRGHPEGFRADEKMSKVRTHHHHHHHHHHHRVSDGANSNSSSSEKVLPPFPPPPPKSSEDVDRKNMQPVAGAYRNEAMYPSDNVSEDIKRLENLSSMMASVESDQTDDSKRRTQMLKEAVVSPPLPPLPSSTDILSATSAPTPGAAEHTPGRPPKQSKHSKSRLPIAQQPTPPPPPPHPPLSTSTPAQSSQANPSVESWSRDPTHERKSHKKKSPLKDHQHKDASNTKSEVAPLAAHLQTTPTSSKKERHKSDKRALMNQEGLKVKISLNKGEVKTASESNHILPPPPLPAPPAPAAAVVSTNQPNLKMKINRKYLENNGNAPPPPLPQAKEGSESKDASKSKDMAKPVASGSGSDVGKKQESLKLVISKDRLSQGSYGKKQDRESRKRERGSPKGHDPLRNSDGYPNKMSRMDHHSGRGGSRNQMPMPPGIPPQLLHGPPQGHHYPASNGKADGYLQSQQLIMQYGQPQFYPNPHQQYFPYQGMPPGYSSQGLPQFLTNPPPPPPPPPPHEPPPLPRDPPPAPPPLPPE